MDYVTVRETRMVNDNGNDMGIVKKDTMLINSWVKPIKGINYARYIPNRWIPLADCKAATEPEPPPVEPPPPPPPQPDLLEISIAFRDPVTKLWGPYHHLIEKADDGS